ncbi:MAG: phosphoenolpyruvate--protein phosphotransferase [Thermosphaera sp.]
MKVFNGLVASPGIAIGVLRTLEDKLPLDINKIEPCTTENPEKEVALLREAKSKVLKELVSLAFEDKELLEAFMLILENLVDEAEELVFKSRLCGLNAIINTYTKYDQLLAVSGSELINLRRSDLKSLVSYLVTYLKGAESTWSIHVEDTIIYAEELSPIELMKLKNSNLKAIVTRHGGTTSHVAILARTYGIPYLIIPDYHLQDYAGGLCVVDAFNGKLIIDPPEGTLKEYVGLKEKYERYARVFKEYSKLEAKSIDNVHVKVNCNVGLLEDLRLLDEYGCDGVGLFRVEFLYIRRRTPPTEKELLEFFDKISRYTSGREIIIRAPDLGADKPVEYLDFKSEYNPQLGMRGIRLLLKFKEELFYPFLRALVSVNKEGNIKLLLPMVTLIEEINETVALINSILDELREEFHAPPKPPKLGIMIETPSTVLMLDKIIEKSPVDFISIGTNDLTQYILAVDRTNPRVAYLYSELHPAVLRSIKHVVEVINSANRKIEVEICGEMASQTRALPIILALGITKLSVPPSHVGKVKYYVSRINISIIKSRIVDAILTSTSSEQVEKIIREIYSKLGLEYIP